MTPFWKMSFFLIVGAALGLAAYRLMGAAGMEDLRPTVSFLLLLIGVVFTIRDRRRARRRQP